MHREIKNVGAFLPSLTYKNGRSCHFHGSSILRGSETSNDVSLGICSFARRRFNATTGKSSNDTMPAPIRLAAVTVDTAPDFIQMMAITSGNWVDERKPSAILERRSRSRRAIRAGKPRMTKNRTRNIGNWSNAILFEINAFRS